MRETIRKRKRISRGTERQRKRRSKERRMEKRGMKGKRISRGNRGRRKVVKEYRTKPTNRIKKRTKKSHNSMFSTIS